MKVCLLPIFRPVLFVPLQIVGVLGGNASVFRRSRVAAQDIREDFPSALPAQDGGILFRPPARRFFPGRFSFFRFLQLITPLPTIRAEIEDRSYLVYRFRVKTSFITSARAKAALE